MKSINLSFIKHSTEKLDSSIAFIVMSLAMMMIASTADAGGVNATIFDDLATATDEAIFGPLGQAIIGVGAAAGGLFAIIKGAWMLAGLGIAVAALMVGAQFVANSAGFGALI